MPLVPQFTLRPLVAALALLALGGCASFSRDGGMDAVSAMTQERVGQPVQLVKPGAATLTDAASSRQAVDALLAAPLSAESAVQIALRNNQQLQAALAGLGASEADLVQGRRLRNPSLSFGRISGGGASEIDRSVSFDVIGLLSLPWRSGIEGRRFEQAKLQAAAQAVQLVAETRRAYFTAVAALQTARFMERVRLSAEASAELAQAMTRAGNWSQLEQAREQVFYAEAMADAARAAQAAVRAREQLTRLLGLWGAQAAFTLPERLPDLPAAPRQSGGLEGQAMEQRLDVQMRRRDAQATASALGLTRASAFINVLDAGYANKSSSGAPRENGYEVSLELPIFDWGDAKSAKAEALYMQALARTADAAVRARSEVREAYAGYRSSYDLARHYRDEVVPLRKKISKEVLLRYNGMLASVFELLADAREQVHSVNTAIETQRDFWIADTALQSASHGGGAAITTE